MDKDAQVLDERAAELLKLLVERYIREGQPVASRTLARASGVLLSSATIRNVMADLDELGLVSSPHSSAGSCSSAARPSSVRSGSNSRWRWPRIWRCPRSSPRR